MIKINLQVDMEQVKRELQAARETIQYKDKQISDLKEKVDKLESVLQRKVAGGARDILASIQVFI